MGKRSDNTLLPQRGDMEIFTKKGGRKLTPRTGRPPLDDSRKHREFVRLNDQEKEKLDYCSKTTGKTKAEIIREGIDKVYQELKCITK